ncbi:hypothetical protein ABIF62_002415 [Bradyrhizobium japonicum]
MKRFLRKARRVRELVMLGVFLWKIAKFIYEHVFPAVIWSRRAHVRQLSAQV